MKHNKIIVSVLFLFLTIFLISSVIAISNSDIKIIKTYPRDNPDKVIADKEFKIKFREASPASVELYYRNIIDTESKIEIFNLSNIIECQHKTANQEVWECSKHVNVSDGEIEFFFKVKNAFTEVNSEVSMARFDSTAPDLLISYPEPDDVLSNFIRFTGEVNEESKVWYEMDNNKKHRLCSKCTDFDKEVKIPKGESSGIHTINIFAEDKAGNAAEETRQIFIN